jgi:hypothetical protein
MKKNETITIMTKANTYSVKRIEKDVFELWHDDECLATLTKEQAWPVMIGRVHPSAVVDKQCDDKSNFDSSKEQ